MRVEQCACGSVHLTIGAVTLRLEASALDPIATVLGQAAGVAALEQLAHRRSSLVS